MMGVICPVSTLSDDKYCPLLRCPNRDMDDILDIHLSITLFNLGIQSCSKSPSNPSFLCGFPDLSIKLSCPQLFLIIVEWHLRVFLSHLITYPDISREKSLPYSLFLPHCHTQEAQEISTELNTHVLSEFSAELEVGGQDRLSQESIWTRF